MLSLGLGQADQQLPPDLSFVIRNYGQNFRPAVNILLVKFWWVAVVVTWVKQAQLLDFKSWSRSRV